MGFKIANNQNGFSTIAGIVGTAKTETAAFPQPPRPPSPGSPTSPGSSVGPTPHPPKPELPLGFPIFSLSLLSLFSFCTPKDPKRILWEESLSAYKECLDLNVELIRNYCATAVGLRSRIPLLSSL